VLKGKRVSCDLAGLVDSEISLFCPCHSGPARGHVNKGGWHEDRVEAEGGC